MDNNTTSSNNLVKYLNMIEDHTAHCLIIPLVLGLVGNSFSCIVFRQKQFRSNAISNLFMAASIFNIVVLVYGISINLYSVNYGSPTRYSIVFCKVFLYIRHILLMIVRSYIVLACIASFSLTSPRVNLRSIFQSRFLKWFIFAIPFLWPLIAIHMPIFTMIQEHRCVNVDSYVLPFGIYFFLIVGIFPVLFMTLFILLTVKNLKTLHRRVQPSIATPLRLKTRDQQFIRMLTSLVLMYITTNIFYPTNVLYLALTYSLEKSKERIAFESLIFFLTSNYILYINSVSPFFLFICSSTAFRRSFYGVLNKYKKYLLGRRFQVRPPSNSGRLTG